MAYLASPPAATGTRPVVGRSIDLICVEHQRQIAAGQCLPAGLVIGEDSGCYDCRSIARQSVRGLYMPFDWAEHDLRLAAAEHEAGHAVVHVLLGHRVDSATVSAPDGPGHSADGYVRFTVAGRTGAFGTAVTTWAGTLAHRAGLHRRGILTLSNQIGCAVSAIKDTDWLHTFCTPGEIEDARDQAETLVAEHADDITRVAAALAAEGVLHHDQIRDLIHTPLAGAL